MKNLDDGGEKIFTNHSIQAINNIEDAERVFSYFFRPRWDRPAGVISPLNLIFDSQYRFQV